MGIAIEACNSFVCVNKGYEHYELTIDHPNVASAVIQLTKKEATRLVVEFGKMLNQDVTQEE